MRYTRMDRGRSEVQRRWWFGDAWDGGGFFQLTTWSGLYLLGLRLIIGGEDCSASLALSLLWRTVVVSVYIPRLRGWVPYDERETGFTIVQDVDTGWWDMPLSAGLWRDPMGASYGDRWRQYREAPWRGDGWSWYAHPFRWIPGDSVVEYDASMERTADVTVSMPEGDYAASWRQRRCRWQRPRWFAAPWVWRYSLDIPGGVPLPGKGENSWDCEDDATYGVTFAVQDHPEGPEETACRFVGDHLQSRARRGGARWAPRAGWPTHASAP